jgi:hypothetical protein
MLNNLTKCKILYMKVIMQNTNENSDPVLKQCVKNDTINFSNSPLTQLTIRVCIF